MFSGGTGGNIECDLAINPFAKSGTHLDDVTDMRLEDSGLLARSISLFYSPSLRLCSMLMMNRDLARISTR